MHLNTIAMTDAANDSAGAVPTLEDTAHAFFHSALQLRQLMDTLQSNCTDMLGRVVQLPKKSILRVVMLNKLVEVRLVLRGLWKSAHMLAPCPCKLQNVAAAANSVAVCLFMLQKNSLARKWFAVALSDAERGGIVHSLVTANMHLLGLVLPASQTQ
jgi:hypothetical protein